MMLLLMQLAFALASVTHSCLVSPDTPVHRVDSNGGTLFYILDGREDRKYCLTMTSAYSKVTQPTPFGCRECLFSEPRAPPTKTTTISYEDEKKSAMCMAVCGVLCMFVGVFIADIFGMSGGCEHEELKKND